MGKTIVLSGHGMVNLASSPAFVTLPARTHVTVWAPNTYVMAGGATKYTKEFKEKYGLNNTELAILDQLVANAKGKVYQDEQTPDLVARPYQSVQNLILTSGDPVKTPTGWGTIKYSPTMKKDEFEAELKQRKENHLIFLIEGKAKKVKVDLKEILGALQPLILKADRVMLHWLACRSLPPTKKNRAGPKRTLTPAILTKVKTLYGPRLSGLPVSAVNLMEDWTRSSRKFSRKELNENLARVVSMFHTEEQIEDMEEDHEDLAGCVWQNCNPNEDLDKVQLKMKKYRVY